MKTMMKMILCVGFSLTAGVSQAACSFDVKVGDNLKFSLADMTVEKSCESITVNLTHSGNLPANVMGHNWVLSATADLDAVVAAGMEAGLDAKYVKLGDSRVLAVSGVVGGGETTSVNFSIDNLTVGGDYMFFCSVPGHSYNMRGIFVVQR
jgi:azurin